jgi:hypothetical protein
MATNIRWNSLWAAVLVAATSVAHASGPDVTPCPRVRVTPTPAGLVLEERGLADLVARLRTSQFVEIAWTREPNRIVHIPIERLLDRAQLDLARRLVIQPISARHLIFAGDRKLVEQAIGRAVIAEIPRVADGPSTRQHLRSLGTGPSTPLGAGRATSPYGPQPCR